MRTSPVSNKPRYCCWVLNYRCMLRCKMCGIWGVGDTAGLETTLEQKMQFVRSLRGLVGPGFEFHLSGGEPLLTEGVFELIRGIAQEGYTSNLVTNGFLIDKPMARAIVDSGLDTITISLDGLTPGTHDAARGVNGSYERIMRAIGYLDELRRNGKPKISLLTVIMACNLDEIVSLAQWAQADARVAMISFQAVTQPFCEERDDAWFSRETSRYLWPQDIPRVVSTMEKLRNARLMGDKIGNHPNHFLHFAEYFKDPNSFLKKIKCNLGDYEFHIDPYGKAFFCCLMEPFGNIKVDNLADIWRSERACQIRQKIYHCKSNCHIMINCFYEDESSTEPHVAERSLQ